MKKYLLMLGLMLTAYGATAQIKIGNKSLNLKKAASAVTDVAKAVTLSDDDVAALSHEAVVWMDANNPIDTLEYGKRLARLTENLTEYKGLKLNFKVYWVTDVNAFACADGSIRVFSSLMDILSDDELMAIIGHEIGHVLNSDVKDAMKNAYLTSAARNAAGSVEGTVVSKLSQSQLGDIASAFTGAQFSQKQEYAADEYGFDFAVEKGYDPYAMSNVLMKFVELSNAGGAKASAIQKMFSSHPDSEKRSIKMKEKADKYKEANP